MFSIYETRENREEVLKKLLSVDSCVALVIAFLDFEWTVRRCILALGRSSTKDIHAKFSGELPIKFYRKDETAKQEKNTKNGYICGLKQYNELWSAEVFEIRKIYLFDLLKSRVKISSIEGFDQCKFNPLKLKKDSIKNTDVFLDFVYKKFRNTLVHGIRTNVQDETAKFVFNFIVACSRTLCNYAEEQGLSIYGRKIDRRKTL